MAEDWQKTVAAHAEPVTPTADQAIDAILQDAAERAYQRQLCGALAAPKRANARPAVQAAFCIDVRSEVFRRAFEAQSPEIETIGFAGFFGLPLAHKVQGTDLERAHLPALLTPSITTSSHADEASEQEFRIAARATRAWGRFRQAAVSSFAFVEAAGPLYGWKLVKDALGLGAKGLQPEPVPHVVGGLTPGQKADAAAAVLQAMSLTKGHARLVLLLGHGAQVTNNPHESAYHCGACAGQTGEVSSRVLAKLLNDPETRAGLAERGIDLPDDTFFLAGMHDTVTDDVGFLPRHARARARGGHRAGRRMVEGRQPGHGARRARPAPARRHGADRRRARRQLGRDPPGMGPCGLRGLRGRAAWRDIGGGPAGADIPAQL